MKERSLVAFTLLSQMAVGAFWVLVGLRAWAAWHTGTEAAGALTDGVLLLVGPVMLLGIVSSFFHLGTPFKSWRAIANLHASWLSREVLFALLFAAGTLLFAVLQWLGWGASVARSVLAGTVALLGLALLVSMTRAYRLRTVPAWDTWTTPAAFLITACLLGGLGVGVSLGDASGVSSELLGTARQWIALGAIVLLSVDLLVILIWIAGMSAAPGAAALAAARITQEHGTIFRVRLALTVAAVAVSGAALTPWGKGARAGAIIALAFGLVLTAEVLGRVLFYEARVRHGV
jgi:anaerobic dimethyl sulfoxide reductase subunit C (anchor subunit)